MNLTSLRTIALYAIMASSLAIGPMVSAQTATTTYNNNQNNQNQNINTQSGYKHQISTELTGSNEVPPVTTNRSGALQLMISPDEQSLNYTLTASGGASSIVAAHLHCGALGQNGPIIVPLFERSALNNQTNTATTTNINTNGQNNLSTNGIIQLSNIQAGMNCSPNIQTMAHLVQAIREGRIYANVHTVANPNGEIRGQLMLMTHKPGIDQYHNNNTFVFDSDHLRISEMNTNTGGTNTDNTRTFVVTISSELLNLLSRISTMLNSIFHSR